MALALAAATRQDARKNTAGLRLLSTRSRRKHHLCLCPSVCVVPDPRPDRPIIDHMLFAACLLALLGGCALILQLLQPLDSPELAAHDRKTVLATKLCQLGLLL